MSIEQTNECHTYTRARERILVYVCALFTTLALYVGVASVQMFKF